MRYSGIGVTRRIAIGRVFLVKEKTPAAASPGEGIFSAEREREKLTAALEESRGQIREILERAGERDPGGKNREILATQLDFFDDPAYNAGAIAMIQSQGISAAEAVRRITRELWDTFNSYDDDPYMKERASDIADVGGRLLNNLTGGAADSLRSLPPGSIVVARELAPSQTAQLDLDHVLGFVTETGSTTCHTAIMARSIGIAAVVGCPSLMDAARNEDLIILDAHQGTVLLRPDPGELERYTRMKAEEDAAIKAREERNRGRIFRRDGRELKVEANIGNPAEAMLAKKQGARGVGLFRTEFLFLSRADMPGEEEQYRAYRQAAEIFGEEPVTIRTLDVGGDKMLPYLDFPPEENPALGMRAIRLCLNRRGLFKPQLRAILRASPFGNLRIMFPMISRMEELEAARGLLRECMAELDAGGLAYRKNIAVGMMIETPATAILAEDFAAGVDFFSIGTNDLTQYTLAVDRGNPGVRDLYDGHSPAVMALVRGTIRAAQNAGIPCGMCGELASDLRALASLVDYGLEEFSVGIDMLGNVREALQGLV
jgi:phosphotransferase system enzyme I (PtsI)